MQEANAISFLPERQPRALTFITANAPTKKAGMYAGLPSFNDPVPWRPLAVLSHFFGCGSATVTVAADISHGVGELGHLAKTVVSGAGARIAAGIVGKNGRGRQAAGIEVITRAQAERIDGHPRQAVRVNLIDGSIAERIDLLDRRSEAETIEVAFPLVAAAVGKHGLGGGKESGRRRVARSSRPRRRQSIKLHETVRHRSRIRQRH